MHVEIEIETDLLSFDLPDEWDKLSREQWWAAIMVKSIVETSSFTKELSSEITKLACNFELNKEKISRRRAGNKLRLVDVALLGGIVEGAWMSEVPCHGRSYLPKYWIFRGMKDHLINCNMQQLGLIQQWMKAVRTGATGSEKEGFRAMRGLMAVCFRPYFIPWSSKMCDIYMSMFRLVPKRILVANMYNVWGMLQMLRMHYEWVYNGDEKDESGAPDHGFRALLESLAGDKFGDYYKVLDAKLHDVFTHMDLNAYRISKMKSESKSNSLF